MVTGSLRTEIPAKDLPHHAHVSGFQIFIFKFPECRSIGIHQNLQPQDHREKTWKREMKNVSKFSDANEKSLSNLRALLGLSPELDDHFIPGHLHSPTSS